MEQASFNFMAAVTICSDFGAPQNKGYAKDCSNYCKIPFILNPSKVMLQSLQARLQQYVNCEIPDV